MSHKLEDMINAMRGDSPGKGDYIRRTEYLVHIEDDADLEMKLSDILIASIPMNKGDKVLELRVLVERGNV